MSRGNTGGGGMLYLIGTPIGNLGDISVRALDTLRAVDTVVAEDTRRTGVLLRHYDIRKPQISFRDYQERRAGPKILDMLRAGSDIALVTDAGTPAIADPGFWLVRECIRAGLEFTVIPGPTAFVAALVLSGLPVHSFIFRGFPPRRSAARRTFLAADADSPYTLIYYESPYRIHGFLADAEAVLGNRPACLANDLTKLYETVQRGLLADLVNRSTERKAQGEYTVVIAGKECATSEMEREWATL